MAASDFEIFDDVPELLRLIGVQTSLEAVMDFALRRCRTRHPADIWDVIEGLPFSDDLAGSVEWLTHALEAEAPTAGINGFWFGIFSPVDRGLDFYVSGSRSWPSEGWPGDTSWWPESRYRQSTIMSELHRLTTEQQAPTVTFFGQVFLSLAFTGATVAALLPEVLVGARVVESGRCGVAFGHDSGDFFALAEVDSDRVEWLTA